MRSHFLQLAATLIVLLAMSASATVRYVDLNSASPTPPYTNWSTAATTIQDAVDVAVASDEILVTNGVYRVGGRLMYDVMNRLALNKPVTVRSVNGPVFTVIEGNPVVGDSAIRCAYLGDGAMLAGFTLTNGATRDFIYFPYSNYGRVIGGGIWCEYSSALVSNCVITGNSAKYQGGGAAGGVIINCTLAGNSGFYGGGSYANTLINCTLIGNSASSAGGADSCTLSNCTLSGNSAFGAGGANASTLINCAVIGNESFGSAGGVSGSSLTNCTLVGNRAADAGGGAYGSSLANCVAYYNFSPAGPNYSGGNLQYCCTTPLPATSTGNFATAPQLADAFHLNSASPCRGAGNPAYAPSLDIDAETWFNPPSVGCDEFHVGGATGPLSVTLRASFTNFAAEFIVDFAAEIVGRGSANRWEFGDGTVVSNSPYASHAWSAPGDYPVTMTVYNGSIPTGVTATVNVHVQQGYYHVRLDNLNPVPPYASWATAATNIQDAVDVAATGGTILVSNGVYQTGGRAVKGGITNRVAVDKVATVRSVNGPTVTTIKGYQVPGTIYGTDTVRCAYLTNAAVLLGFTLTNGSTWDSRFEPPAAVSYGGGVWCESASAMVSNCVIVGNWAGSGGGASGGTLKNCVLMGNVGYLGGGGASGSSLDNCLLIDNHCFYYGAGALYGTLNNCTLVANIATNNGGGVFQATVNNCILYDNLPENYYYGSTLNYCCTTPLPDSGSGNITNAPQFVDLAGGNLRLQSNSPCINTGANGYAVGSTDLDGRPRIVSGTVDIGAYEFQGPGVGEFIGWLQQYGLLTDGSADYFDSDSDLMNNWQEWIAGTVPTDLLSVLRMETPDVTLPGVLLRWSSDTNHVYSVERATSLAPPVSFTSIQTNIPGLLSTTACTDTTAPLQSSAFYRVGADSTNASVPLVLQAPVIVYASVTLRWNSVINRTYFLERGINLGAQPPFSLLKGNIAGQVGTTSYTDTNAIGDGPFFYRVGVQQ